MIKIITKYDDIDKAQWNDLLYNRSNVASFFQSPDAYQLFAPFDWAESVIVAVEENNILTGVVVTTLFHEGNGIIRKLTSRAIINGGPLLDKNISDEALGTLLYYTISILKNRCIYIETRNFNDYSRWREIFEKYGFSYQPHYNFHIDTTHPDIIEKRFSRSRRYEIRQSLKDGAYIDQEKNCIPDFYSILHNLYKTKIRVPLFPLQFFQHLSQQAYCKIFIIHDATGRTIGGQVSIFLNGKAGYAWFCCGLDHEYKKTHPSVLANYSGIRYAADNGIPLFDMMGAGSPGDGGYGVREFKAQFGGQLVEHGRYLYLCRPMIYKAAKWALHFRKKL